MDTGHKGRRGSLKISDYSQNYSAEPVDGIREVYYGFVLSSTSSDEVTNLLGLFNMIATVSAFIAGIIMAAFTSVNIEELNYAEQVMQEAGYGHSVVFTGMQYSSACGLVFSGFAILISAALSISLSSLNIGGEHPCCDALLLAWLKLFHTYYSLTFFSLWACVIFMTFGLFFIGCIKYPTLANGENSFTYGTIGVSFMILITCFVFVFIRYHMKMVDVMKEEFKKFNAAKSITQNPMMSRSSQFLDEQPMRQNAQGGGWRSSDQIYPALSRQTLTSSLSGGSVVSIPAPTAMFPVNPIRSHI